MEQVNRVLAFQKDQNLFDVIAKRPKQAVENSERLKMRVNLGDFLRQWRHDDHAKRRQRVSMSSSPLHYLTRFVHSVW